jgi:nucleotide-binding universal stress UspA family protein
MEASFKHLLVDIDATAIAHPALERGIRLARSSGATLTIVDVMSVSPQEQRYLPEGLEERMAGDRRRELASIAASVPDVRTQSKLLVGRPATALVQEVLRSGADLLLRSHARDMTAPAPPPFGAVDMELLRTCPCPILLVRHGSATPHPRIAAAVDASTDVPDGEALNAKILELALAMASHLGAESVTVLNAWAPFAEYTVRSYGTADQFAAYVEDTKQRAGSALARLVQSFDGREPRLTPTLRRGDAADVIPPFVVAEDIDLVVMGSVARKGIAGLLIGNTAERLLRKLPCSVLVVKPDGFESPVRLDTP